MNLIYLAPSQSSLGGGVTEIQRNLAKSLMLRGLQVDAYGIVDSRWEQERADWLPAMVRCYPSLGPKAFSYSPALHREIAKCALTHDVLHLHCLWLDTSRIALAWKTRHKKKLVVSINGFLEGWALNHHKWRKRLVSRLYERRMLGSADLLHANTEKERNDIYTLGLRNRVEIIPNGVSKVGFEPYRTHDGIYQLSFLGRIHRKKGIIRFLEAWASLSARSRKKWRVVIAGWDTNGYSKSIQSFVARNGLSNEVRMEGPKFGEEKRKFIQDSAAMFLTSESEGMPMAALECLAHGRLLLMTEECNIDVSGYELAAIVTKNSTQSIRQGLEKLLGMSEDDRIKSNDEALRLARERFCWAKVAETWQSVYESL